MEKTFAPVSLTARHCIRLKVALLGGLLLAGLWLARPAQAQAQSQTASSGLDAAVVSQVRDMALIASQQSRAAGSGSMPLRFEVSVGSLDPRLKLAACQRVEPYLPAGVRLWGKSRIGLRCVQGERPWNVYLPITVHVYGQALVAAQPLAVGTTLSQGDLAYAEVDLAEDNSPVVVNESLAIGRALNRALTVGQGVRQADLRSRQWFAAGDTVKVVAVGKGFSVSGMGTALSPGFEGQSARVRTEGGQIVSGMPVGSRQMEMTL